MTHVAQMSAQLATQEKPLNSAWSREDNWVCTGVSVGCSLVNSSSKLLVSAVPFCGTHRVSPGKKRKLKQTYDGWEVWWGNALMQNVIEIHVLEERMSLDLLCIALSRTKTSCRVASQQL